MSNKKSGFLKIFLGKPLISEKSVVSWGCRKIAERWAMEEKRLEMLKQLAAGIAAQFGSNCEVVIHDVSSNHPDHSIVHIENGHVSGRKVGDGASQVVLDQLASSGRAAPGSPVLSDPDAGRQDPEVLHAVHPQPARGRDGDLLHQLRRIGPDDDPEHASAICCPPRTRSRRSRSASSTSTTCWTSSSSSPWPWWASLWP